MQRLAFILFLSFLGVSCSDSRSGIILSSSDEPLANVSVQLVEIDDSGEELSEIERTTTDENGEFELSTEINQSKFVLKAVVESTPLMAFAAGTETNIPIDPLTDGLVSLVIDITKTEEGRSLSDFSVSELRSIGTQIANLDTASLDSTNSTSVLDFLRTQVGREIAEASGGTLTVLPQEDISATITQETDTFISSPGSECSGLPYFPLSQDGDSLAFKVREDGSICREITQNDLGILSGTSLKFFLQDDLFEYEGSDFFVPDFDVSTSEFTVENGRQITLGPVELSNSDISLKRKLYAPEGKNYIRYVDIFENNSSEPYAVNFNIDTYADITGRLLVSDGDEVTTDSRYLTINDTLVNDLSISFIFQDDWGRYAFPVSEVKSPPRTGGQLASQIRFAWSDLTIPQGDSASIMYFVYVHDTDTENTIQNEVESLISNPDFDLLTFSEMLSIQNFSPSLGTLQAEAGFVIGRANVTASKLDENDEVIQSVNLIARVDGSFDIPLEISSGNQVQITASDGLDEQRTLD